MVMGIINNSEIAVMCANWAIVWGPHIVWSWDLFSSRALFEILKKRPMLHGGPVWSTFPQTSSTSTCNVGKYLLVYVEYMITGWWFGTFFIFPYIGNSHPNWLIFFRGVQTTNQISCCFLPWKTKEPPADQPWPASSSGGHDATCRATRGHGKKITWLPLGGSSHLVGGLEP